MYFYETLKSCDDDILTEEFLKLCENSPDLQHTKKLFLSCLKTLKEIKPNLSDTDPMTIFIEQAEDMDGSLFYDVYARYENDTVNYSLEINPWADTLGYFVDEQSISRVGAEVYTALVLWEITWFGYDEETIQNEVKEWDSYEYERIK